MGSTGFVSVVHRGPQMPKQCTNHFKTLDTAEATRDKFRLENPHFWSELRTLLSSGWSLLLGECELVDISEYKRKINCSDR
jgi:hypothetical protein